MSNDPFQIKNLLNNAIDLDNAEANQAETVALSREMVVLAEQLELPQPDSAALKERLSIVIKRLEELRSEIPPASRLD